tara:strand:+ start:3416 stop:3616 length:201 start_codon:yes stop_codon:yes gene_type:complete
MTTKRKMVCVDPRSNAARLRFVTEMSKLHSCYIDNELNGILYLTSINGKYRFSMNKKEDKNWAVVK